jgi:hypothetical protein
MTDEDPAIRVGDAERRAADDRLQRAHGEGRLTLTEYEERAAKAWEARTQADLDVLTSDLPAAPPAVRQPVAVGRTADVPSWARRAGGLLGVLVAGAAVLWGGGQLLGREDGAAVFSSRTIAVAPGDDRVEFGFLFSSTEVVVPDDARVVTNGAVVFGSVDCGAACAGTGTGPEITVDTSGAFGSVDVRTVTEAAADRADRDDDRDDGDDD